jgi:hypothetical protein
VDHGAGKSYLGFIIYDLFYQSVLKTKNTVKDTNQKEIKNTNSDDLETSNQNDFNKTDQNDFNFFVYGVENRTELVQKSNQLKNKLEFENMSFLNSSVKDSATSNLIPETVDIVTALHACNTATDEAIEFALAKKAKHIVLVPCCQAEIASLLKQNKSRMLGNPKFQNWVELFRHPIHTREFGSHLTNVLRCLWLESKGYQLNVTELVGWEHSVKNELIIASFNPESPEGFKNKSKERLHFLIEKFQLQELSNRF